MTGHGVGLKGPAWELWGDADPVLCAPGAALAQPRAKQGSAPAPGAQNLSGLSFLSIWENGTR